MKNISFSFLFLLIAFCGVTQIPRSVGTISFLIPAVYSMASFPEGVLLSNVDENKNTYFMFVYLAQRYSGNPQSDFNEAWNKMYGSFSKTVSGSIPVAVKKKHLKGWDYYEAGADCVHNNGQSYYS